MFIPCKVSESPHPYLSHNWGPLCRIICSLKLCPREPSCLIHSSIMTAVIYYLSQLYPSFLYSAKKKKKGYFSATIFGFLIFTWASPSSSSVISIWNSVQSTLVCMIEASTKSRYKCGLHQLLCDLAHVFYLLSCRQCAFIKSQHCDMCTPEP